MNELIETLRGMADMLDGPQNAGNLVVPSIIRRFREAAETIERLETENTALHKQLAEKDEKFQRYEERLNISPYGDDKIDELEESNDNLRFKAETAAASLARVTEERDALTSRYGDIIHVVREHDECDVMLLLHKDSPEWSFVNLTKKHICPCRFTSREEAIKDLRQKCIRYEQ